MASVSKKTLLLFDVDGTLTLSQRPIEPHMKEFLLQKVKPKVTVGLVGGSDLKKIALQMGGEQVVTDFDYVFAENGLIAYKNGVDLGSQSILKYMGEAKLQAFINYCLRYMSELALPCKRGNFVEFRTGLINVCPVGRSCTLEEREAFHRFDLEHGVRDKFVAALRQEFPDAGLVFAIGGQISIDAYPEGWDKTYCLRHLEAECFEQIHFFGDRTEADGNDHAIYVDPRTIGHKVSSFEDTRRQVEELLRL
ncbi:phosphomannomutase [Bacillus rossius redtenbacheri]|uniref:phosphomannomutase n=1 Tax=Bacillus rossius redtenbacheri TaxID=93214 RepID=UPI002FDD04A2